MLNMSGSGIGNLMPQIGSLLSTYDQFASTGSMTPSVGTSLGGVLAESGINAPKMQSALGDALAAIRPIQRQPMMTPMPSSPANPGAIGAQVDPMQMLQYILQMRNQLPPQITALSQLKGM